MNILVAGGAGFIGSHLIDALLKLGHRVVCADKLVHGDACISHLHPGKDNIELRKVELADQISVDRIFSESRIDAVYHLAANSDIQQGAKNPSIDFNDTFLTTRALLEGMRRAEVRKLFFASTSAVYGDLPDEELNERTGGIMPVSYYGGAKLAAEALISSYAAMCDMSAIVFRFPNVIGTRLTHGVVFDFIRKLESNKSELAILGDGSQCKPYMHVDDLVEAVAMLTSEWNPGVDVFNIGVKGEGTTVAEIARIVVGELGLENVEFKFSGGTRGWKGDVPRFRYDITKALGAGWHPRLTSDEAVRKAVRESLASTRYQAGGLQRGKITL